MVNKKISTNLAGKGFTIIEILVVVAIIGILAIAGTIKRKESLQRKRAEMETLEIKQMIELARDHALTGEVITSGIVPNYFQFEINSVGEYKINAMNDSLVTLEELESGKIADTVKVSDDLIIRYKVPYADCSFVPPTRSTITICGGGDCTNESLNYTIRIETADTQGKGSVTIE